MAVEGSGFGIGSLSRQTGCNIETIRYYERIGLLPAPPRTAGGHRSYDREHVRRLGFIRRSRELGFPLDEVRALLRLADGDEVDCGTVQAITVRHLRGVRERIQDLRRLERTLKTISDQCAGGVAPHCPVIEALSGGPHGGAS